MGLEKLGKIKNVVTKFNNMKDFLLRFKMFC